MSLVLQESQQIKEFFNQHQQEIEENLLAEAGNVREKIEEIQLIGNINLIDNAHRLIGYVVDQQTEDLVKFAEQEGIVWAKHSMTLMLKLEWVHAIRRTLWSFLYKYDRVQNRTDLREEFYTLETTVNEQIDTFLNEFFISYSNYREKLLDAERELVENLSVQVIPISTKTAIFPIIGSIDPYRAETIKDKVLAEIGKGGIQTLIIDLSGVADMEVEFTHQLLKVIDGISLMGCKAIITGTRPEIASQMVNEGLSFRGKAEVKGNLEQAITEVMRGTEQ